MKTMLLAGLARLCVAAVAATSAMAWADPPSRVGRISHVDGATSFYADREEGWTPARLNFPVTSENSLWTAAQGRAEVRIGGSALRIDDSTILDFVKIDDDNIDTYLQRGTLNIRSRNYAGSSDARDRITVATSEGRFVIDGSGRYRIDAAEDGSRTRISVFAGRVRYESSGNTLTVDAGKSLIVNAGNGGTDFRFENARESSFDGWAETRDARWDETHRRYVRQQSVSPYMTGYEELDTYGDWVDDREYGRIWTPRVVALGWTPYRYGSWAYVNPWGWTWVDDAPWGFAPFHYGRWVQVGPRWSWWPGAYTSRPVYAPALVGWMGERPGVHVSVTVGPSIGWFPLAPREHYLPAYTNNITYIRNINYITNNVTIVNPPTQYANRTPGATFVSGRTFVTSRPIQSNAIRINAAQTNTYPVVAAPELPNGTWGSLRARAMKQSLGESSEPGRSNAPPIQQSAPPQAAAQPATPSYGRQFAPQFAPQNAPLGNDNARPLRQQGGEVQRGSSWQERRNVARESAPPSPSAIPAPIAQPPQAPIGVAPTVPNGNARPIATPPREAAQPPNDIQRMREQRNIESGEQRGARPFGSREERGYRDERSIQRQPNVVRPAETSRPPVANRPVESRPQRVEQPAAAHVSPSPPVLAQQAPRPLARQKQDLRD